MLLIPLKNNSKSHLLIITIHMYLLILLLKFYVSQYFTTLVLISPNSYIKSCHFVFRVTKAQNLDIPFKTTYNSVFQFLAV
jgi:hypothetical protein